MAQEIERKFLLRSQEWRPKVERSVKMAQGYLSTTNPLVRVRVAEEEAFLTIKGPTKGLARDEFEYAIPVEDALALLALCQKTVTKVRHYISSGPHTFEIDEFSGDNEGLIVLEVELGSEDEEFHRPDFLGEEVTYDHRYKNSQLVENPYRRWKE